MSNYTIPMSALAFVVMLLIGQQVSFDAQDRAELRGYNRGYSKGLRDMRLSIQSNLFEKFIVIEKDTPK